MLLPSKTGRLLGMLVLTTVLVGCRCGEPGEKVGDAATSAAALNATVGKLPAAPSAEVLAALPAGARWLLYSNDPPALWHWLNAQPAFGALRKTFLWQDLKGSEAGLLLATLRQRINRLSEVSLGEWSLESLAAAPLVVAGYAAGKGDKMPVYLLVKAIDLRLQALDRLAEAFNQIRPEGPEMGSFDWEGIKVRTLSLGGRQVLYYCVFSNLLLASNGSRVFLESLALVSQQSKKNSLVNNKFLADLAKRAHERRLLAWSNLAALGAERAFLNWTPGLLPGREVAVTLDRQGDEVTLHFGPLPDGWQAEPVDRGLLSLVPDQVRLLAASSQVDLSAGRKRPSGPDNLPAALRDFRGQLALVLGGVEIVGERPLVHGALLMKRTRGKWTKNQAGAVAHFILAGPTTGQETPNGTVWQAPALAGKPSAGLLGDWLVVTSTAAMFDKLASCAAGRSPSLAGWKLDAGRLPATRALVVLDAKSLAGDLAVVADWRARSLQRQRDWHQVLDPILAWAGSLGRRVLLLSVDQASLSGTWSAVGSGS